MRILQVSKYYKSFFGSSKLAVNNLSFNVDKKESFGLVGPNGAGKSSTFYMILNSIMKSGGRINFKNSTKYSNRINDVLNGESLY